MHCLGIPPGNCCPVGLCVASSGLSCGRFGRRSQVGKWRGAAQRLRITGIFLFRAAIPRIGQGQLRYLAPPTNHGTAKWKLAGLLALGQGIMGGRGRPHWRHSLVSGLQESALHLVRGTLGCGISSAAPQEEEEPPETYRPSFSLCGHPAQPAPGPTSQGAANF